MSDLTPAAAPLTAVFSSAAPAALQVDADPAKRTLLGPPSVMAARTREGG